MKTNSEAMGMTNTFGVGSNVFVYGTLRRGQQAYYKLDKTSEYVAHGILNGARLYDMGSFPALRLTESVTERVIGEVYRVTHPSLPAVLDLYEGYPTLYDRREVTLVGGLKAWVYIFSYSDLTDAKPIEGDWCKYSLRRV